jgi:hypothetical protein
MIRGAATADDPVGEIENYRGFRITGIPISYIKHIRPVTGFVFRGTSETVAYLAPSLEELKARIDAITPISSDSKKPPSRRRVGRRRNRIAAVKEEIGNKS